MIDVQQICFFFKFLFLFRINDFPTKPLLSKTHTWISLFSLFQISAFPLVRARYALFQTYLLLLAQPPTNFSNLKFRLIQFFIFLKIEWRGRVKCFLRYFRVKRFSGVVAKKPFHSVVSLDHVIYILPLVLRWCRKARA